MQTAPQRGGRLARALRRVPVLRALVAGDRWRYAVSFLALGINLYSAAQIHNDYYSAVGGIGWIVSLLMLVLAFLSERPTLGHDADTGPPDVEERTDTRLSLRMEWAIFLAIFVIALLLRVYRLDDWTTGTARRRGRSRHGRAQHRPGARRSRRSSPAGSASLISTTTASPSA